MNWLSERESALRGAECVVVKVGSAVLSTGSALDVAILDNLADQLVRIQRGEDRGGKPRRVILVSSGAGAAGRVALADMPSEASRKDLAGKQAIAAIGQGHLMHLYDTAFSQRGVRTAQVLLTRDDLRERQRFINIRNTFCALLGWGVIPVVNENDTVSVNELKFSDNDNLASLLLNAVEADLFVNLTTIGGVLDANPLTHHDAKLMPCIEDVASLNLGELCGGKTTLGTGGMYSKLLSATRAAQLGVPTYILPGRDKDIIPRAFAGEAVGTWVRPSKVSVSRRKYWLAYQVEPQGSVFVDDGAAKALTAQGKSLLPVGIKEVQGTFSKGTLVKIVHFEKTIGVGLSNYDSEELKSICGLSRLEVAVKLGDAHYPEVIHRDNMLIGSAN